MYRRREIRLLEIVTSPYSRNHILNQFQKNAFKGAPRISVDVGHNQLDFEFTLIPNKLFDHGDHHGVSRFFLNLRGTPLIVIGTGLYCSSMKRVALKPAND